MSGQRKNTLLIGLVGPCASGKSTLGEKLRQEGWNVRHIAQEHSYVQAMWQKITRPDILIFLNASYTVTCARRRLDWTEADYAEQQRRLTHARAHAQLVIETDSLSPQQVLEKVLAFLRSLA